MLNWKKNNMKFKRPQQAAQQAAQQAPVIVQESLRQGGQSASILLAHNDETMRAAIASLLKDNGFMVVEAVDGRDLGGRVSALADGTGGTAAVDAIIAHSSIPGMSGLQILRELRSSGCTTPVILLMPQGEDETRETAFFLGATAVFMEPVVLEHLIVVLINVTRILKEVDHHA